MLTNLLPAVTELAQQAGQVILPYWRSGVAVQTKADDSPVTAADLAANQLIVAGLTKLAPDIPILSEEGSHLALATRQAWQQWWLVDPLDGTKEFIAGNADFTVNIALIDRGEVVFGVVVIPVNQQCYFGGKELGAWLLDKQGEKRPIHCRQADPQHLSIVASRRHNSQKQQQLMAELDKLATVSLKNAGSSLKFCLLAEGSADCYPRFAPTSQWDTAAAQGVLEGAGGAIFNETGEPLNYLPQEDYLNPNFIALADTNYWYDPIFNIIQQLPQN